MYKFIVCSVFKNEAHILEEWLLHYLNRGVEHFYLVNDNSNDEYMKIIEKYSNYITLYHNDIQTKEVGRQILIYEKYFRNILTNSKWVAILDLDEFLYSPYEINLPNVFEKYNEYSQIRIIWLQFGSNCHLYQPQSVVDGFTKRAIIDTTKPYFSYKTVFKGETLISFSIHSHRVSGNEIFLNYKEYNNQQLLINHYSIQSQDFFLKIKATRGDCDNWADHTKIKRNLDYFNSYDINEIDDYRLSIQNQNIIKQIKINKIEKLDEITLVITTCNRPELLNRALTTFVEYNTYPVKETYIIDYSGFKGCNDNIIEKFINKLNIKAIYHNEKKEILQCIYKVYSYVTSKYIFYCPEDCQFLQEGFIEKMLNNSSIDIYNILAIGPKETINCLLFHPYSVKL